MNAADIMKALGGAKYGKCLCPAHEDENPSLSVTDGEQGRVLVYCHAGCSQEAVVAALKARDLWPQSDRPTTWRPSTAERESEHKRREDEFERKREAWGILRTAARNNDRTLAETYLRERGITTVPTNARVLTAKDSARLFDRRFPALVMPITSDKGIVGAHVTFLDKEGTGKLATDDARRTYGVPKGGFIRLGPIQSDAPLIVAEGIETTLAAMALTDVSGIAAISTGGMKAVRVPACSEVIIAADNDEPGRDAAEALADRLLQDSRSVRIALPEQEGDDWNDELIAAESDADRKRLRRAILRAEKIEPPEGADLILPMSMVDFLAQELPPAEYLVRPWLETGALAMVHAWRGVGKTWFALSVAHAVATGTPLLNWAVRHAVPVLYVDGELSMRKLHARLGMLGPKTVNLQILTPDMFSRRELGMPDLSTEQGRAYVDRVIEHCDARLIVLDSLSTLVRTGDENEASSWAPLQAWFLKHRGKGRSTIIVHHEGKSGTQRGHSKHEDVLDTVIRLRQHEGDELPDASCFELHFMKTRDFYGAHTAKLLLHLTTADGIVKWSAQPLHDRRAQIAEMKAQGVPQTEIAKTLGVTPGYVSRIVKEAKLEEVS